MKTNHHPNHMPSNYQNFFFMLIISFIAMYFLMFIMVDRVSNIYPNLNNLYMVAAMIAPMAIAEIILMKHMYPNIQFNRLILGGSLILLLISIYLIRTQTTITDKEFVRSMIPHHASALLMCQKNTIKDQEIAELCNNIITSQQKEIDQMNRILSRLE